MDVETLKKVPVTVGVVVICMSSLIYFSLIAKKENMFGLSANGIMEGLLFQLFTTNFIEGSFGKVRVRENNEMETSFVVSVNTNLLLLLFLLNRRP